MRTGNESKTGRGARLTLAAAAMAVALLCLCGPAQAQTFTVTNTAESAVEGSGSLRGEVEKANKTPGADTIAFSSGLSGTILLSGEGVQIKEALDIEGPGPAQLTVAQTSKKRVFNVNLSAPEAVTIAGLHIASGYTPNEGADVDNDEAALTIVNCLITGGTAGNYGGAIDGEGAPLTIRSSVFEGNHADGGGAVWAGGDGNVAVSIESSTFAGNAAEEFGGALFLEAQEGGRVAVTGSTFSANQSAEDAGAIAISTDETGIVFSGDTIAGNHAAKEGAGGIGIDGDAHEVSIVDSTIANNIADGEEAKGGGILIDGNKPVRLANTIVAGNSATVYGPNIEGSVEGAFDLIPDTTGASITESVGGSDVLGKDPQLGPLQANGGPTQTIAIAPTSPAVNQGSSAAATDQRGSARVVLYPLVQNSAAAGANGADIGAYELGLPPPESNRIKFGKLKLNPARGTATIKVTVPGPGTLVLSGKGLHKVKKTPRQATFKLVSIKSQGAALKRLKRTGKVKLKGVFRFTPAYGPGASKTKTLTLKKKPS